MKEVFIKARDGYELALNIYEVSNPKGYVQFIHGMTEHQNRYAELCEILNKEGYTVITSDMRGHGKNAPLLGFFKEKKGYLELIADQQLIREYIKTNYEVNNLYLIAHSMGTIIARNLLRTDSKEYKKIILSGYPGPNPLSRIGIALGRINVLFFGPKHFSPLISKLIIGPFNKSVKKPETEFDWLSYNKENINKYINDNLCGFNFLNSAFLDLTYLVIGMEKKHQNVNKDLDILMLCGIDDPCTRGAKGIKKSQSLLRKAGFDKITAKQYDQMRHEIFNEDNKGIVFKDLITFIND